MADITKADIQEMLDQQSERFEHRSKQLLIEQDVRQEAKTREIVLDAIDQVMIPVLDEILEVAKETRDQVEVGEKRLDIQQTSLDDHDARISTLEAAVRA